MHVPAFNTMLLALSALQATAIPSYSPATSSVDKRTSALLAIPYVLMKNFIDHVVGVFSGYGVLAAQEHAIVGKPHFNFVWLGAEFRSNGYPTIRADVVVSKNINYHMDVKIYQLDGSIYPMETSGSLKVETLSDKGYERVTFLG